MNLDFFKWLKGDTKELIKRPIFKTSKKSPDGVLKGFISEAEDKTLIQEKQTAIFVDPVTQKEYKTERGLKCAITRRKNKQSKKDI